ncbi:MBL fold hydrolase [Chlorella sorokiniana]|uniref:MBL fold hydrolase n=1 Tax=Chlorella sorokiniana TaxID=3076 RepID=A0A2P6TY02_CHLSO|nr:MBL fold hydrolase [Chlorella sorokiniana]|eukprot:PRW58947.1 MBL fold hydrolase [Chlorella sorokiniana]
MALSRLALLAGLAAALLAASNSLRGTCTFKEIVQDVFRYQRLWQPLPGFPAAATIWLVREQGEAEAQPQWVLIDAGFPDRWSDAWNTQMMQALRKMVPAGRLKAILLTHSHTDHVAGVPNLLAAYPDAQVVVHEKEVPFLTGQAKHLADPGTFWRVLHTLGLVNEMITLPRDRLRLLRDADSPDGAPSSAPLREAGVQSLAFIPTPGHSPGHVSYLHEPTGAVLGGDVLLRMWPRIRLGPPALPAPPKTKAFSYEYPATWLIVQMCNAGDFSSFSTYTSEPTAADRPVLQTRFLTVSITPTLICPEPTCDYKQIQGSVCHMAALSDKWTQFWPNHDVLGQGMSREEFLAFAAQMPGCDAAAS